MAEIKKISTELQLLNKFLDTSGSAGSSGSVLTSTATGTSWVSAGTPGSGVYLPLAGGTMTGNIDFNDDVFARFGNGNDLEIGHDASNSYVTHSGVGNLIIRNTEDDSDIVFQSDNGAGGVATYLTLNGTVGSLDAAVELRFPDGIKAKFGSSQDLLIYHDGSNSYIDDAGTGDLYIRANNLRLANADGSGQTINANNGGNVELFHNNSKKFETTSTGVAVVGKISLSGKISGLTAGTANTDAVNVQQLNDATTGALIFKGTWSAASTTTGVHALGSTSTTIVLENDNFGVSLGSEVTGTGIPAGTTVTTVFNPGAFGLSATITMTNGAVATFTTVGGIPDLSQTARKVTGDYYICETAGVATPNGASTTPNEWAVGDWVAFSDLATDAWQKIDNSSVLSGAGTGGSLAAWSGSGTSVTLQDAPATFSGNNTTFAGSINMTDNKPINYGGQTMFTHTGSQTRIGDNTSSNVLTISGGNATFTGNVTAVESQNGTSFIKATNTNSGVSATARLIAVGETSQIDMIATSAGYTGVTGWADSGIISTDSGASGGLILNSVAGVVKLQTSQTNALTIDANQNIRTYAKLGIRVDGDAIPWRGTAQIPAVINLAGNGAVFTRPDVTYLSQNFYYNAGDIGAVIDAGKASLIEVSAGEIKFLNTTTGASSNATISVIERMRIESDGNLRVYDVIDNIANSLTLNGRNTGQIHFQAGGADKMRMLSNGRFGIGTTNPAAKLQVIGTTGLPATSGTTFTGTMRLQVAGYGTVMDFGAVGPSTGTQWIQVTDATNQAFNYSLLLQPNGGNVGIGTTSPGSLLHIKGETKAYITFEDTTDGIVGFVGDAAQMLTSGSTDNLGLRGEGGIQFGVSDVIKMRLDSSGNLGIGTTSPGEKLDINGTLGVYDLPGNLTSTSVLVRNETIGSELMTNGDFATGSSYNGSYSIAGGQLTKTSAGLAYQVVSGLVDGGMYLIKVDVASIAASTNIYLGGNNSGALVAGLQEFYLVAGSSNDFTGFNNGYAGSTGTVFNSISLKLVTSASNQIQTRQLSSDAFGPGNGPYLPLAGGTMNSGAGITFNVPSAGGSFINVNHSGNEAWTIAAQSGVGADDYLDIGISGGTRAMSWHETGNVGIGTNSPGAKLEVETAGTNSVIITDNSDTQYSLIQHNAIGALKGFTGYNSGFMIYGGESGVTTRLQAGGSYAATILTNGNFGIGTTSPGQKLHINDGSTATTTDANNMLLLTRNNHSYIMFSCPDGKDSGLHFHNTTDNAFVGRIAYSHEGANDHMLFDVNSSTRMDISANGAIKFNNYGAGFLQTDASGNITAGTVTTSDTLDDVTDNGNTTTNSITVGNITSTGGGDIQGDDLYFRNGGDDGAGTRIGNVWYSVSTGGGAAPVGVYESAVITTVANGTHGRSDLVFKTKDNNTANFGSSSERMRITKAGNVGIGTTAPTTAKLVVAGGVGAYSVRIDAATNAGESYGMRIRGGTNSTDTSFLVENTSAASYFQVRGDGNVGIAANPTQKLHVGGNVRVTGAFYDSSNDSGTAGQLLSSTATGTDWVDAPSAGSTVFTPSIFEIDNQAITSGQNRANNIEQTLLMTGSTGVTIASGQSTALIATKAGVYEISFTIYVKTTHTVRQVIGAYVERQVSGSQPAILDGSLSAVYMRVGGANQGGEGTITNTFYADVSVGDTFRFRTGRTDANTAPVGVSIAQPTFPSGVKQVISFRKINALP